MNVCRGVLALTLVVRDEEDILAANLDYHLAQGVDVILVIDHGSVDSTPAILTEYGSTGRVRSFRDEARPHRQAARVNRLLKIAAEEHQADWVIHCDADEFWMPAAGSLRDVFGAIPDRYG
ncbi:MAG: glycosyltransferase family 2 protein, partial [Solirubrobacterales bacterium]|nr:glycosyltransferase family 2 protein [Solirubrobacterales bacterium]